MITTNARERNRRRLEKGIKNLRLNYNLAKYKGEYR